MDTDVESIFQERLQHRSALGLITRPVRTGATRGHIEAFAIKPRGATDDFVDRFAIVGPPERCIERLKELQALGLDKVAISGATRGAAEVDAAIGRKLVAEQVLPGMQR